MSVIGEMLKVFKCFADSENKEMSISRGGFDFDFTKGYDFNLDSVKDFIEVGVSFERGHRLVCFLQKNPSPADITSFQEKCARKYAEIERLRYLSNLTEEK
jgi:hypothetical protein